MPDAGTTGGKRAHSVPGGKERPQEDHRHAGADDLHLAHLEALVVVLHADVAHVALLRADQPRLVVRRVVEHLDVRLGHQEGVRVVAGAVGEEHRDAVRFAPGAIAAAAEDGTSGDDIAARLASYAGCDVLVE